MKTPNSKNWNNLPLQPDGKRYSHVQVVLPGANYNGTGFLNAASSQLAASGAVRRTGSGALAAAVAQAAGIGTATGVGGTTGDLADGVIATISGGNSVDAPTILGWDNFEGKADGAALSSLAIQNATFSNNDFVVSATSPYAGTRCAYSPNNISGNDSNGTRLGLSLGGFRRRIYVSYRYKWTRGAYVNTDAVVNKWLQLHGTEPNGQTVGNYAPGVFISGANSVANLIGSSGADVAQVTQDVSPFGDFWNASGRGIFNDVGWAMPFDTWHHIEFILTQSSAPGAADGRFTVRYNGVQRLDTGNIITRASTDRVWDYVNCPAGNQKQNTSIKSPVYIDMWHVQDGHGRVVLTNASTWAASTIFEPQPCLSATTYRVSRGALPLGTVYEYRFTNASPYTPVNTTGVARTLGTAFSHGDSVAISGTGFGATMPTFAFAGGSAGPLETTAVGTTPSSAANTGGFETSVTGFNWTRFKGLNDGYATVVNDATRGKCIGYTGIAGQSGECAQEYHFPSTIPLNGKLMVKYHSRHAVTNTGGSGPQYKMCRLNAGQSAIQDTANNLYYTYNFDNGGMFLLANTLDPNPPNGNNWPLYQQGADRTLRVDGQWQRTELKIITPTAQGAVDGQVYIRSTRNSVVPYIAATANGFPDDNALLQSQVKMYPNANRYSDFMWQNWWGNGYTSGSFAIDDHYIQIGSFACVELWNTNDPATATLREIQEPTSWSNTSITVRLNKGGLPAGTYYLVVLADSVTDTVLASQQITIL